MRTQLSTKVIVSLVGALGLLLAGSQLLSGRATRDVVQDVRRSELDAELGRFRQELDDLAAGREQAVIAAARLGEALYREHRRNPSVDVREGAAAIGRSILESTPDYVLGVGVYFEPNVFGEANEWIGPYATRGDSGPAITWEYANDEYNYPTQGWYTQVVPQDWDRSQRLTTVSRTSEPYVDSLAGRPTVFQSVVHVMHDDDGRVIGVVSVDSTGSTIDALLESYRPTPSSSAFFADARGLVMYPRPEGQLMPRADLWFADRIAWDELPEEGVFRLEGLHHDGHEYDLRIVRVRGEGVLGAILATDEAYAVLREVEIKAALFGLATLIAVSLVVFFVVRRLMRPLSAVTAAAARVAQGDLTVKVDSQSKDEIGRLAESFTHMVEGVRARDEQLRHHAENLEATVAERTASIKLILDSTGDAFLPVARDGSLMPGVSRSAIEWFGAPQEGQKIWDYLFGGSANGAIEFEMAFEQIVEDVLPFEMVARQMPKRIERRDRVYQLDYRRVGQDDQLESVLVVAQDVTARVQAEQRESEFRETYQLVSTLMRDRDGFRASIREIEQLMAGLESSWSNTAEQRRDLHTIKGSAAILGFGRVASACHAIEDRLVEEADAVSGASFVSLRQLWSQSLARIEDFLSDERHVQIHELEYQRLVSQIASRVEHDELLAFVRSLRDEATASHLARLGGQATRVARQLEKQVEIEIVDHGIRLAPNALGSLWTTLVHVVRNAMDHGLETPEQREAAGKPAAGKLVLATKWSATSFVVSLADDGRGIDWERVRAKAEAAGLPAKTHENLVDALFSDGVSTKDEVSDLSGRGVGLSAVRASVLAMGGTIRVQSERGRGTTFEIEVPATRIGRRRASMRPSKMPPVAAA